jgi:DNA-binding transcriptional regulator YhcF (GntR family)
MKVFNDDMPIYLQLRKHIEEQILARAVIEEEKLKSFRELAAEYRINPITVGNAINALVDEGILYNKRGIGVFVASGAREKIISSRRSSFVSETLEPSLRLAKSYEIPKREILKTINDIYGEEK